MDLNWSKLETNWSKQKLEKEGKKTCFRSALCSCWRLTVKETKLRRWRPAGLHPLSTPGVSDRELIHLCLDVLIPANAHLPSPFLTLKSQNFKTSSFKPMSSPHHLLLHFNSWYSLSYHDCRAEDKSVMGTWFCVVKSMAMCRESKNNRNSGRDISMV